MSLDNGDDYLTKPSAVLAHSAKNKFRAEDFKTAIELYVDALNVVTPTTSLELKRRILADRSQAYLLYGDIHTALRDINLALSSEYTLPDSPKGMTAECYIRRAKTLHRFMRYSEARLDHEEYERLCVEGGVETTTESSDHANEIDEGLRSLQDSTRRRNVELLQAIDSRGIIVRDNIRPAFAKSPAHYYSSYGNEGVIFKTNDGELDRTLADPNRTPIAVAIHVIAPFFKFGPSHSFPPYYVDNPMDPVPENDMLEELLSEVFSRAVMIYTLDEDSHPHEEVEASAIEHDDPNGTIILIRTARGRLLAVPRKATVAEIFAGARWPQDGPMAFTNLCKTPRVRDFEDDGVELGSDSYIELHVIPDYELNVYLDSLDVDGSNLSA